MEYLMILDHNPLAISSKGRFNSLQWIGSNLKGSDVDIRSSGNVVRPEHLKAAGYVFFSDLWRQTRNLSSDTTGPD